MQLRKHAEFARETLSQTERDLAEPVIIANIGSLPTYAYAQSIAVYLSFRSEVNLSLWIDSALSERKNIYLPVVTKTPGEMRFQRWSPNIPLFKNRYGILQPEANIAAQISSQSLDIALIPLLAFDRHGHRLGMGGGYYDRAFSWRNHPNESSTKLVGIGFNCQFINDFDSEEWDVTIDYAITETGLHDFT